MKVLLLLFSIYLLALGCLPCADDACSTNPPTVAVSTPHTTHCQHQENCPPFCTCACCSIFITAHTATYIVQPVQQSVGSPFTASISQPLVSSLGRNIWQPPRLG